MTSIQFGGGPTLEQRRQFAGLKEGSHVPLYQGYCPQLKYRCGKTYGDETHDLSKSVVHRRSEPIGPPSNGKPFLRNELPEATGDNKLTKEMVPGYTGYIPRRPFKFGATYKNECDISIDEHLTGLQRENTKMAELQMATARFPSFEAQRHDPVVRDHLNTYRDTHPHRPILMDSKRQFTEPPIPGYMAYVPRIYTTEAGLGCRYHDMTQNGLNMFCKERQRRVESKSAPITINRTPTASYGMTTDAPFSQRVYLQDGMIPKYTGYIPQRMYNIGRNYGDTTRSLEVCSHDMACFGDFTRSKTMMQASLA